MMMPFAASCNTASLVPVLLHALDALETEGYSFWLMEEAEIEDDTSATGDTSAPSELEGLRICFDSLPADMPLLPGEIELLASVLDDILFLASLEDRPADESDAEARINAPQSASPGLPR